LGLHVGDREGSDGGEAASNKPPPESIAGRFREFPISIRQRPPSFALNRRILGDWLGDYVASTQAKHNKYNAIYKTLVGVRVR
jgi:IS30 family transposase